MNVTRLTVLTATLAALALAACGGDGQPWLSIADGNVDDGPVEGNVAYIQLSVDGIELAAPDGDTSGESGHLHVFVDRNPRQMLDLGDTIPKEEGIIHTTDTTIEVPDLQPGEHTLWVMLGDGNHALSWPSPVGDRVDITVN